MAEDSFAYGLGWGVAAPLINIETVVTDPPFVDPEDLVPILLGDIRRQMADRSIQVNGITLIFWRWESMSQDDLNLLIFALFGDFSTAWADLSIDTLTEQGVFAAYDVKAERPRPGEHYDTNNYGWIENLVLPLYVENAQGGFTDGFTVGFEV